jgi:TPR repeat protein
LAATTAPLAYYLSVDTLVSASTPVAPSPLVTLQQRFDAVQSIGQRETVPIGSHERALGMSITPSISPLKADIPRAAPTSAVETVALRTPQPAGEEAPRSNAPVRTLDREAIALLVRQGDQLMSAGDIAAARTVYQRASDAGDVGASVALAASYDPTALKRLGVVGKHADLEKARSLYERAERLGSTEATRRLHVLAKR